MLSKCYLSLISATAYIKDTRYCLVLEVLLLVDVGLFNISERCLRDKGLVLQSLAVDSLIFQIPDTVCFSAPSFP